MSKSDGAGAPKASNQCSVIRIQGFRDQYLVISWFAVSRKAVNMSAGLMISFAAILLLLCFTVFYWLKLLKC
jgi:hypothetical protein